jgi:hypothetical protein
VFHDDGPGGFRTIHPTFVFGAITDAQSTKTKAELMSYFMAHLPGDGVPPQSPASLTAAVVQLPQGFRLRLTWPPVTEDVSGEPEIVQYYAVHRATSAHFAPSGANQVGVTPGTVFLDRGAPTVGDPDTNYFYVVCAVDMGNNASAGSAPAGEFDFGTE